jgi:hypothetical protein
MGPTFASSGYCIWPVILSMLSTVSDHSNVIPHAYGEKTHTCQHCPANCWPLFISLERNYRSAKAYNAKRTKIAHENRTRAYPNWGTIPVRTNWPVKMTLCAIPLRTDVPKISTMYDPGCGQVTPVWTEVRSVMWTDSSWVWLCRDSDVVDITPNSVHNHSYISCNMYGLLALEYSLVSIMFNGKITTHRDVSMLPNLASRLASCCYQHANIHVPGIWHQIKIKT